MFNCDKCSQSIPITKEKEHELILYKREPALIGIVSEVKYRILCPSCYNHANNQLIPGTDFTWAKKEQTPTYQKYQEHKEKINQSKPLTSEGLQRMIEEDWQEHLKKGRKV